MKKSLIALAALAASGFAMAQSSVTMFGIVDANIGYTNHNGANGGVVGMGSGGNNTSRLGFRGVEDLGGGLKAGFWLEGALVNDTGAPAGFNFQRESTVRLSGGFGEVRLGREQTPTYRAVSKYDAFGQVGFGRNEAFLMDGSAGTIVPPATTATRTADAGGVRQNNMISYYSPKMGGFSVSGGYGFHEKTNGNEGRYMGLAGGYDNGPLSLGMSYESRNVDIGVLGANKKNRAALGASYDFGAVKLIGSISQNKYKVATPASSAKVNTYALGLTAPVGAGTVKAQYALYDQKTIGKAHHLSVGYQYDLSKRTALYTTASYMKNNDGSNMRLNNTDIGGAAPGAGLNQTGVQAGIRHSF